MPKTLGDARHEALIEFIIRKRKEAGLTQIELADRLKVYQSLIARIESGERRIDVIEFIRLGDILGFDPSKAIQDIRDINS
jgi:transcriptional regulator with XRE-family HTH domain